MRALDAPSDPRFVTDGVDCDCGGPARAAELHALSYTLPDIANSRWYYDVAGRQLNEMAARLPAEVAKMSTERGRKLDLWQTAEALSAEITPA